MNADNECAKVVRRELDKLGVPETLRREISFEPAYGHPNRRCGDPLESINGATGAALWLGQSVLGHHPAAPSPTLAHCFARRRYLRSSARYNDHQSLDIWCPDRAVSEAPTQVFLPGGAWVVGHRRHRDTP